MPFETLLTDNATIHDTLREIVNTVNQYSNSSFVRGVVEALAPTRPEIDFCKRVFDWACRNVKYQLDGKTADGKDYKEEIWTPAKIIDEGIGDCKKFSILIASILKCAGIPCILKHVSYGGNEEYTHIYVIVPNPDIKHYLVLDPTNDCTWNKEVQYEKGTLYFLNGEKMELWKMGKSVGAQPNFNDDLSTAAAQLIDTMHEAGGGNPLHRASLHPQVKQLIHQGVHPRVAVLHTLFKDQKPKIARTLTNIPIEQQRGAFLSLIHDNDGGLATHLLQVMGKDPNAFKNIWHTVGGDLNTLKEAVIKGSQVKATPLPKTIGEFPDFSETGVGKKRGIFKKILHAAGGILKVVAPVANAVIPGSGAVINGIANKAEQISETLPTPDANTPPPPAADVPADKSGVAEKTMPNAPTTTPGTNPYGGQHGHLGAPSTFIFIGSLITSQWQQNPAYYFHTWGGLLSVAAGTALGAYAIINYTINKFLK